MARVNLDSTFFSDPRIEHLGRLTGEGKQAARGRLAGLWLFVYDQTRDILTAEETDIHSEWFSQGGKSFGALMVEAMLAERLEDGTYRIKGAKDRYSYIIACRENAREGGKKSAEKRWGKQAVSKRLATAKHLVEQPLSDGKANNNPLDHAHALDHAHDNNITTPPPIAPQGAESEPPPGGKSKRFTPPSPDEVEEYGEEIGYKIDGGRFCDYYASRGWLVGKNKMKDWRAAVRTWRRNDEDKAEAEDDGYTPTWEEADKLYKLAAAAGRANGQPPAPETYGNLDEQS